MRIFAIMAHCHVSMHPCSRWSTHPRPVAPWRSRGVAGWSCLPLHQRWSAQLAAHLLLLLHWASSPAGARRPRWLLELRWLVRLRRAAQLRAQQRRRTSGRWKQFSQFRGPRPSAAAVRPRTRPRPRCVRPRPLTWSAAAPVEGHARVASHALRAPPHCQDPVASGVPPQGRQLVGCRVRVWWAAQECWYSARVERFDGRKNYPALLHYDEDGEQDWCAFGEGVLHMPAQEDEEAGGEELMPFEFLTSSTDVAEHEHNTPAPAPALAPTPAAAQPAAQPAPAAYSALEAGIVPPPPLQAGPALPPPLGDPAALQPDLVLSAQRFKQRHAELAKKKVSSVLIDVPEETTKRKRPPPSTHHQQQQPNTQHAAPSQAPAVGRRLEAVIGDVGAFMGAVIGIGGRNVREIESLSGATVRGDNATGVVTVTALSERALRQGVELVEACLEKARRKEAIRVSMPPQAPRGKTGGSAEHPAPSAAPSAAAMPDCLRNLVSPQAPKTAVPHADVFRGAAASAPSQDAAPCAATPPVMAPVQPPLPPLSPPPPLEEEEARAAFAAFCGALDKVSGSVDSISAASRAAVEAAGLPGLPAACVHELSLRLESRSGDGAAAKARLHLFWVVDSVAQNAHKVASRTPQGSARHEGAAAFVRGFVGGLSRLVRAVAPEGAGGRATRPHVAKVLSLWADRGVVSSAVLAPHVEALKQALQADPEALRAPPLTKEQNKDIKQRASDAAAAQPQPPATQQPVTAGPALGPPRGIAELAVDFEMYLNEYGTAGGSALGPWSRRM